MSYIHQSFPSDDASLKLLNGHQHGVGEVVAALAFRALLIAPALFAVGVRKGLARKSLAASSVITIYGLAWLGLRLGHR